jgi:hypothetical protein
VNLRLLKLCSIRMMGDIRYGITLSEVNYIISTGK